jgi:hypothetical protein
MFHFKIRDLLWLTLAVALAVAWWIDVRSRIRAHAALHEQAAALQAQIKVLEVQAVEAKVRQAELQIQLKKAEIEYIQLHLKRDSSQPAATPADEASGAANP